MQVHVHVHVVANVFYFSNSTDWSKVWNQMHFISDKGRPLNLIDRKTQRDTDRTQQRETDTHTKKQTDTERDRETHRETDRHTERQTVTQTCHYTCISLVIFPHIHIFTWRVNIKQVSQLLHVNFNIRHCHHKLCFVLVFLVNWSFVSVQRDRHSYICLS